jgi:rRNA maturation endonuclease Nob1
MTECFWCDTVFDAKEYDRCPKCNSDLNTKEIKIIEVADED